MSNDDNIDDLKLKTICHWCIEEEYLKAEVRRRGRFSECSYCSKQLKTYTIEDIANCVETAFQQHFVRTPDQPSDWQRSLMADRESQYEWQRDGDPAIYAIEASAQIPEQAAADILAILQDRLRDFEADKTGEETDFSSDSHYVQKDPSDVRWQENWNSFQRSLKTEARFFSRSATTYLGEIFDGLDKTTTIDGNPLLIYAGPGMPLSTVFRARVFQSDEDLKEALCRPDEHLGPPPSKFAIAGRMNAGGISIFYGANDPNIAISEVRPPVGSKVAIARFDIIRPLRLLDLTALRGVVEDGSIFDLGYENRLGRATFLRSLAQRLTRPVMPNDEAFEYLPTQAIADFLAAENQPMLDGIVFPSVQAEGNGLNVALFHKAARVAPIELPKGSEVKVFSHDDSEDSWGYDYLVYENIPRSAPTDEEPTNSSPIDPLLSDISETDFDPRKVTLMIDPTSLKVHEVKSVHFEFDTREVKRHTPRRGSFGDMDDDIPF
jgi:hypothetical protein